MIYKYLKIFFILIFTLFLNSCEQATDIDVPRVIDYEYETKKNIELSIDTLDFGFVDKDAFYKELIKIKNLSDEPILIKRIYFKNTPSIFYFEPGQKLEDLIVPINNNKELNFFLNLKQGIVGEFEDILYVETDTIYSMILKSTVPDIVVKEHDIINLNLNEESEIYIKIINFSNYNRKLENYNIINDSTNIISFNNSTTIPFYIYADDSFDLSFKIKATQKGIFNPRIEFEFQGNLIQKNYIDLNIVVN